MSAFDQLLFQWDSSDLTLAPSPMKVHHTNLEKKFLGVLLYKSEGCCYCLAHMQKQK